MDESRNQIQITVEAARATSRDPETFDTKTYEKMLRKGIQSTLELYGFRDIKITARITASK